MSAILGVDPSLSCTGWAVGPHVGVIRSKDGLRGAARLVFIRDAVERLIDVHCPCLLAIEGYSFASDMAGARAQAELRGVLYVALHELYPELRLLEVPPTSLKLFAAGRGNAKKDEMRLEVFKRWGMETRLTNDAVDAFALAKFGEAVLAVEHDEPHDLFDYQVRAVYGALGRKPPAKAKKPRGKKASQVVAVPDEDWLPF